MKIKIEGISLRGCKLELMENVQREISKCIESYKNNKLTVKLTEKAHKLIQDVFNNLEVYEEETSNKIDKLEEEIHKNEWNEEIHQQEQEDQQEQIDILKGTLKETETELEVYKSKYDRLMTDIYGKEWDE